PKRQVKIIPEVGGRLIEVHDDLAEGNIISKGELLFEIDGRVYKSKVRQVEAEIRRLEAQLRRHEKEKTNLTKRIGLARQQEELAAIDFKRETDLFEQGGGRAPEVERAHERLLARQDAVLAYESRLDLIPVQIDETTALLETKQAQLDEAKLNVAKTRIYCPFDARVDSVTAQESQVVIASFQIATLTDMEALEVSVVIDPRELRWTDQKAFAQAVGQDMGDAPEARITWTLYGQEFSWAGKITRLERMDEVTRSAHIVVEIRDIMRSLEMAKGHSRPPLSVGMFCRAELPTEPLEGALVIPRHTLRDDSYVYVFEPDAQDPSRGRLVVRQVPILRSVGDQVLVALRQADAAAGLQAGDLIVVSPLPKAVEGMRLLRRDVVETVLVSGQLSRRVGGTSRSEVEPTI
ncbi:MAG: hypothetical protein KAV82_16515, partial [Phycisphaerae bacterium]|nr:hypothetical protein [Phycisphaerae bacterium]